MGLRPNRGEEVRTTDLDLKIPSLFENDNNLCPKLRGRDFQGIPKTPDMETTSISRPLKKTTQEDKLIDLPTWKDQENLHNP